MALAHGRRWRVAGNISGQALASVQDDAHASSLALTAIPPIGPPWESACESEAPGQWFLLHSGNESFILGWYLARQVAPCVGEGGQHWFSIVCLAEATAAFEGSLARPKGKGWLMHDMFECFLRRHARACFRLPTLQAYKPKGLRDLQRQVVLHKYDELAQSSRPDLVARRRVLDEREAVRFEAAHALTKAFPAQLRFDVRDWMIPPIYH